MRYKTRVLPFLIAAVMFISVFLPVYASEAPSVDADMKTGLSGEILVNGERIEAPAPYVHKDKQDIVMVPLRAIAEKLGLKVIWEQEEEKIVLGYGIQLWIGKTEYVTDLSNFNRMDAAPELTGGKTFVPLDFVRSVLEFDIDISSDGAVLVGGSTSSTIWISFDGNATWFSEDSPYEHCSDLETIRVGKDPESGETFALLRTYLRGDWLAEEVASARMFLKVAEGTPPTGINIGIVEKSWSVATLPRNMVENVILENSFRSAELRREENGWVSIDVTDIVKMWLGGEIPNRGFALFPGDEQALGVFFSGTPGRSVRISEAPRIVINGVVGERSDSFGRFGFTKQPGQGFIDPIVGGNCLSYALRDTDGIFSDDLPYTADDLNRIYFESGVDGILEYTAAVVEEYVEANKEELQISGFRRIDSFESPIDAEKEYRIIIRVSAYATPELPMTETTGYDFHLWAQLNDGRWTQKAPNVFSSIVPGTGPGISPLQFNWDAGDMWGIERWQEWYKSGGVYWAVTKDTDEFTCHKQ